MKFIIAILLTALLGYAAPLFLPWWAFVITSGIVGATIHQQPWKAWLAGFLGMFLLWGVWAYMIDSANEHILSTRVAGLLKLGSGTMLVLVTALVGGLLSSVAALAGSFARKSRS